MKQQLEQVKAFQLTFGQNVAEKPQLINLEKAHLRYDLGKEELDEYLEAVEQNDLVGVADSLTDQLYILCGTILEHGLQHIIEDCFTEVQNSNLSKLDDEGLPIINGENGVWDETRAKGKILKSKNFSEPNLKQFL
jgi:predicted HAD superfamily Cof-like phosphohydrolase